MLMYCLDAKLQEEPHGDFTVRLFLLDCHVHVSFISWGQLHTSACRDAKNAINS